MDQWDIGKIIDELRTTGDFPEGKTLIGTCGDCLDWSKIDNEGWGVCSKEQSNGQMGTVGYNFGCIHFKEKPIENK